MELTSFTRKSRYGSRTVEAQRSYKGHWDLHLTHLRKRSSVTWQTRVANISLARTVAKDWIALEAA